MKIYVQQITADMYHQQEPGRLDKLAEGEFHNLLVLPDRLADVALRLIVVPEQVRTDTDGNLQFGLRYTDRDLRPVNPKLHMARLINRYWQPDQVLPINSSTKQTQANNGFFVPPQTDFEDELLLASAESYRQLTSQI